jgi:hypothetical protein
MSEKSDEADRAWDEDPKEEPAARSGEGEVHRVDTVPPPASGDAYSADTVIRDVPREALDAIREKRKSSENRRAAAIVDSAAKELAVTSDKPAAPEKAKTESTPPKSETKPAEKPPEKAAEKPAEKPAAAKPAAKTAALVAHPPSRAVLPPVTSGELLIAFAAAIAMIVIAFYAIGSAF